MEIKNKIKLEDTLKDLRLSQSDYQEILKKLGKEPSYTELCLFSSMWSEHCSYRTSKPYISKLPNKSKDVYEMDGENAGGVYITSDYLALFKIESHNHPSYIEPFQGAATGVGGILRDIFTMGARPVAVMNFLKFGAIDNCETKRLVRGVSAGIGAYGNSFGVATLGGDTEFYKEYNKNILVNCFALGIVNKKDIQFSKIESNKESDCEYLIYYLGAKTGRDGLHGASMASDSFSDDATSKTVIQVADPFLGKQLLEATLKLSSSNLIEAAQDMGAAGLTSSSVEMADKGNLDIEIDCGLVPLRADNLEPYEIMLSESQERMLFLIRAENLAKINNIIDNHYQLNHSVIGKAIFPKIDGNNTITIKNGKEVFAKLEVRHLTNYPKSNISDFKTEAKADFANSLKDDILSEINHKIKNDSILTILEKIVMNPNQGSKHQIFGQYDHYIQNRTLLGNNINSEVSAGFDYSLLDIQEADCHLALAYSSYPRYAKIDAKFAAELTITNLYRKLILANSQPLAYTNNLNFGDPNYKAVMGDFKDTIAGMIESSKIFNFPTVSGNVSLYNQTNNKAVIPTLVTVGVGKLRARYQQERKQNIGSKNVIIALGKINNDKNDKNENITSILGSRLLEAYGICQNIGKINLPKIDYQEEIKLAGFIEKLFTKKLILQQSLATSGGILPSLLRLCLNLNQGLDLNCDKKNNDNLIGDLSYYFSETKPLYLICCERESEVLNLAKEANIETRVIGKFTKLEKVRLLDCENTVLESQDLLLYKDIYQQNLAKLFSN